MTGPGDRLPDHPPPEWLAAYADGELDPVAHARVEAWLADNPDARAELDTQRRLSGKNVKLWRAAAPVNPAEGSWAHVLAGVRDALANPPQPAAVRPTRWAVVAALAGLAATLVAAIALRPPPAPPVAPAPPPVDAFAVATDDDIDIISLPEADATLLVVGKSPLDGPILLAAAADLELVSVAKDTDGMMPTVQMQAGPNSPMIICPMPAR